MPEPTNNAQVVPGVSPAITEIDRRLELAAERMAFETAQIDKHNALLQSQNAALREHLERRRAFAHRLEILAAELRREQDTMNAEAGRLLSSEESMSVFSRTA